MRRARTDHPRDRKCLARMRRRSKAMSEARLPWSLQENPRLNNWLDFSEPGVVRAFTAKVELGQGIVTAMTQIAAEELALPLSRIKVVSGDTRCCPNESYTAGSMSIEIGGTSRCAWPAQKRAPRSFVKRRKYWPLTLRESPLPTARFFSTAPTLVSTTGKLRRH